LKKALRSGDRLRSKQGDSQAQSKLTELRNFLKEAQF
jgi:hypothetical protein